MQQVSPIEYGHVLLIPKVLECLPQRIDRDSLLLALQMAAEAANPYFRLGYNSLGAFATINHLHFQVLVYNAFYNDMVLEFSLPFVSTLGLIKKRNSTSLLLLYTGLLLGCAIPH